MKKVCCGCAVAAAKSNMLDCAFCRTPTRGDNASRLLSIQKRVDAKDPAALFYLACHYFRGGHGLQKNVPRAIELWKEASELGSPEAHFCLGNRFDDGDGVPRDSTKALRHWEKAAMYGNMEARYNLGNHEIHNGNVERATRHWLISAKMGDGDSLDNIKTVVTAGKASKLLYAEALKGYQIAIEEMRSPERDEAKPFVEGMRKEREN